ncbi:galectin-3-binding protein-like [Lineus longissimus]|uniref:galectin-3-binding protein-like n=1 Tax=Lineus longissimus TaxID=88925 RepID=UPI00315D99F5
MDVDGSSIWKIVLKINGTCRNLYYVFLLQLISHLVADADDALILRLQNSLWLEVRYKGNWGSICYSIPGFDDNAANVACQQMGFRRGTYSGTTVLSKTLGIVLQSVICAGQEDELNECKLTAPGAGTSSTCVGAVQVTCKSDRDRDVTYDEDVVIAMKLIGVRHLIKGYVSSLNYLSNSCLTVIGSETVIIWHTRNKTSAIF